MATSSAVPTIGGILSPNALQPVQIGQVLVDVGGNVWLPFNQATTNLGCQIGIAYSTSYPGNNIQVVIEGPIPYAVFNIGSGNGGTIVAGNVPGRGIGGQVIGTCDSSGSIIMWPSYVGTPQTVGSTTFGVVAGIGFNSAPPVAGQGFAFDGTRWNWLSIFTAVSITGTGLAHVTGGTLDSTAFHGTADQLLVMNHAGSDTSFVTVGGDATYASGSWTTTGLQTTPVSATTPTTGQILRYNGSAWAPFTDAGTGFGSAGQYLLTNSGGSASTWVSMSGDVSSSVSTVGQTTVLAVNGATVPAAGALVTGHGLYVSGSSALSYSALNLAGGSGWVTGVLPVGNLPGLAGDCTGPITSNTVAAIQGVSVGAGVPGSNQGILFYSSHTNSYATFVPTGDISPGLTLETVGTLHVVAVNGATIPAAGSLTTGNGPYVSGSSALSYSALNLAGGSGWVTGSLPVGNIAHGTAAQVFITNSGATAPAWVSISGDSTTTAAGVWTNAKINGASVPAAGALTTGNGPYVSGASALTYSALNLGGGAGWVTGTLPAGNQAAQTMTGDVTGTTAANTVVQLTGATSSVSVIANTGLTAVAGTGFLDFHLATGAFQAPTGNFSWAGASTKTLSLLTNAGTWTGGTTTSGTASLDSAAILDLGATNATSVVIGNSANTTALSLTVKAANSITGLVGATTVLSLGLGGADVIEMGASASQYKAGGLTIGSSYTGTTGLSQASTSTASGQTMTIAAQGATGATHNGALLILTGGASGSATAGGVQLQLGGATLLDVGVTSTTACTLAANTNFVGAAGTGALSLGSMTGTCALPTGNFSWAGASGKTMSLVANSTATLSGSTTSLQVAGTTVFDLGATTASTATLTYPLACLNGLNLAVYTSSSATGTVTPTVSCGMITLTGGPLSGNLTVALANAAGLWFIDASGITLNGHSLIITSGTATVTVTAVLVASKSGFIVSSRGSNTINCFSPGTWT